MKNILSPSILASDFWRLGEQIRELEENGVQYLHIDVMDGLFVPSISFGMPLIQSIRRRTDMTFDVHLMIQDPERYVEEFARDGADLITFHLESTKDPKGTIEKIRSTGKKVGISIKPKTPVSELKPYFAFVDMILIMTVEPGFGGQRLIPECLDKVSELRQLLTEAGYSQLDVEVDGGITPQNIGLAREKGANVIVAGSAVFRGSITENVRDLLSEEPLEGV